MTRGQWKVAGSQVDAKSMYDPSGCDMTISVEEEVKSVRGCFLLLEREERGRTSYRSCPPQTPSASHPIHLLASSI